MASLLAAVRKHAVFKLWGVITKQVCRQESSYRPGEFNLSWRFRLEKVILSQRFALVNEKK